MITAASVVAAAAVSFAASFAGPPAELLILDGIDPAPPRRPVWGLLRPAPPPLAALDGTTGVVLVLEGLGLTPRFGVVGLHPAGSQSVPAHPSIPTGPLQMPHPPHQYLPLDSYVGSPNRAKWPNNVDIRK